MFIPSILYMWASMLNFVLLIRYQIFYRKDLISDIYIDNGLNFDIGGRIG
jgi:hypothetical protein